MAARGFHSEVVGAGEPEVYLAANEPDGDVGGAKLVLHHIGGAVIGGVIDDQDLSAEAG